MSSRVELPSLVLGSFEGIQATAPTYPQLSTESYESVLRPITVELSSDFVVDAHAVSTQYRFVITSNICSRHVTNSNVTNVVKLTLLRCYLCMYCHTSKIVLI